MRFIAVFEVLCLDLFKDDKGMNLINEPPIAEISTVKCLALNFERIGEILATA
jgi:hypothetical protein